MLPHFAPEVFVEGAGDDTALKEKLNPAGIPLRYLKIEVVPPVLELESLQWLHVEIWSLYLSGEGRGGGGGRE